MPTQLTDKQEILLMNIVEEARDRAMAEWSASAVSDRASSDEAFDRGFEAAMDFVLSDQFARFIYGLKSMLEMNDVSRH